MHDEGDLLMKTDEIFMRFISPNAPLALGIPDWIQTLILSSEPSPDMYDFLRRRLVEHRYFSSRSVPLFSSLTQRL